jgi:hypothetical protein
MTLDFFLIDFDARVVAGAFLVGECRTHEFGWILFFVLGLA